MAIKGLNFNIGNISSAKIKGGGLSNAAKFKPSILKLNTDQLRTNVGLIDDIVSLEKRANNAERIVSSLMETNNILVEIQQQLALDFGNRIVEQNEENKKLEKQSSKEKFKEEEENIEKNRKKSERKLGESAKKVVAPIQGMFSKIFNFIKTITGGIAVDFAFNWLKDDKNKEKLEGWFGFIKDHWKWIVGGLGVAAVAQIIGPLAGVFNIVTAAVPMIIGAVKLFASPLGLKVLAAIALGILAFKGGEWIVNKLAGGAEFVEAEKKLGARIQAQEGIVGRFGMTDAGYLLKPDQNNPGKFLKERYIVRNQKGMITDATVFTKRPDGSYYANDEQRAAYKKLESDKKKLALIKKNKDSEIKKYLAKRNKEKNQIKNSDSVEWSKLRTEFRKETEKGVDAIKLKYANKIHETFPTLFSEQLSKKQANLNLTNTNNNDVSKKVTPSSGGEGTITFQNLPGVTTGANVPLGGGGVATQVSSFSSKNNGDPYRLLTPSIYGIFV